MAIKVRDYEVRLTRNKEERRQVRALRYEVFVEEEGASATEEQKICVKNMMRLIDMRNIWRYFITGKLLVHIVSLIVMRPTKWTVFIQNLNLIFPR